MQYCRLNCLAVVLVCLTAGVSEGQSLGRWRMPSTPAQFFGCGYGPGHHAPMIRMPCCKPMSVQRIEVVHGQGCQGACGVGCANQGGMCAGSPYVPQATNGPQAYYAPQPIYGGNRMTQPVQSRPCSTAQQLFSSPGAAMVFQPDLSEVSGNSNAIDAALPSPAAESVPTPRN